MNYRKLSTRLLFRIRLQRSVIDRLKAVNDRFRDINRIAAEQLAEANQKLYSPDGRTWVNVATDLGYKLEAAEREIEQLKGAA